MGSNPINLIVRFLLEVIALVSIGLWGWSLSDEWYKFVLAVAMPLFFALIWGIFNVKGDPSRSGKAPVEVSGILRLLIEFLTFGFAAFSIYQLGHLYAALFYLIVVLTHYYVSIDRVKWLLAKQKQ